ncbi:hypothetical protein JCGZ_01010 [Jatropha curcas]|uniref:Uncharacterized protein n=1 Tax=Jatropha curcas TaxID=180498 RepID=A0A067KWC6_JATCU|nr:hypothetical protein JCGZ_01010 [Jatropha curcas]
MGSFLGPGGSFVDENGFINWITMYRKRRKVKKMIQKEGSRSSMPAGCPATVACGDGGCFL